MKHKRGRLLVIALLCAAFFVTGPVEPLVVSANMDPNIINGEDPAPASEDAGEAEVVEQAPAPPPAPAPEPVDPAAKYQPQIDSINDKLEELEAKKADIKASIAEAKDEKNQKIVEKQNLDQRIGITVNEIGLLEERKAALELQIEAKETDITEKQGDIDESYEQFKKRMRAMQVSDNGTSLGLILGSADFADFLSSTETVVRIADHDKQLMQQLTNQRVEMEEAKASLEETRQLVLADAEAAELKRQELRVQQQAAAAEVYSAEQLELEFTADLAKNEAESKAMEKELNNIYRQIEWDKNPYVGGEMAWPVPGFYNISSSYGWRFGGRDFHTGMDIAGPGIHGSNVIAANGGTVKLTNYSYTPGRGYGIYIIIDHGGNTSTLYGHLSAIHVSVNQVVEKGQVIGSVGNTGWSTGPHLHFEVRLNGAHTNPYPYVASK